jgi:hypothetical protein
VAKNKATRKSKQADLPGMEDAAIQDLESLAEEYVDRRDKRMKLLEQEVELKNDLLKAMKRHRKDTYRHNGVSIEIVPEGEHVKVKVLKPEAEQQE